MSLQQYHFTVAERFLQYVQVDTQSDPFAVQFPSTEKQKDLSRILVKELKEMGAEEVEMDKNGYVYATLPSTSTKELPVLCFCSHVDTSPDCSGTHVKPIVHENYDGESIPLPDDKTQVLLPENHPDLKNKVGEDIITASGKTLLGADDKSGVAIIMDAAHFLLQHPEIKHGKIRILFTPDEEVGKGADKVDLEKLGADFGYTLDGDIRGAYEDENFNANEAKIEIEGIATHPGSAKGKLVNAIKVASSIIEALPKLQISPESTEEKEGFIHPVNIEGNVEKATISFILRSFSGIELNQYKDILEGYLNQVLTDYPGAKGQLEVKAQYRNMYQIIAKHPNISKFALQAIKESGIEPHHKPIRGGTDGAMLSFKGLPCPNIFTGQHAFHSKQEWISIQDMQKAVEVVVRLCQIWEKESS